MLTSVTLARRASFEVALWCYQFTILGDALIFFRWDLLELALECSNAGWRSNALLELLNLVEFQARSYGLYQAVGAIMLPLLPLFFGKSLVVPSFRTQPFQIQHGEAVGFHPRVDASPIAKAILVHAQFALELLEKQLDLPTQQIQFDNFRRRPTRMIGQEDFGLFTFQESAFRV